MSNSLGQEPCERVREFPYSSERTLGRLTIFTFALKIIVEINILNLLNHDPIKGINVAERILAIDDDHLLLQLIQRSLESVGYEVTIGLDGQSGLQLFHESKPPGCVDRFPNHPCEASSRRG